MNNKEKPFQKTKKPWPTKDAMEQVYAMNLWGGETSSFYSGNGSHDPIAVKPYIAALSSFLSAFEQPLTVCDLGCGDFNVGKQLVGYAEKYIAVDIVPDLIAHNKERFMNENLEFRCLDIAVDELPDGDCAIVRQVLQHLSNAEVGAVVRKLYRYKYVVLTEHIPEGDFTPNMDIISGQGIRIKKQSGLNLLHPPFNLKIKEEKQLVSVLSNDHKGKIVTTLYTVF
ncbi:class I SAM-dependent methyltransferase [Maribacter luteus]|uniref:class I SAM-dependent methyltransferase n=1 Tax=Maribacter luteus TaxID=2594478 RepID=UPI0024928BDB|nr:class I SAM-dependent methyltransferase [Maribacter luteus]